MANSQCPVNAQWPDPKKRAALALAHHTDRRCDCGRKTPQGCKGRELGIGCWVIGDSVACPFPGTGPDQETPVVQVSARDLDGYEGYVLVAVSGATADAAGIPARRRR